MLLMATSWLSSHRPLLLLLWLLLWISWHAFEYAEAILVAKDVAIVSSVEAFAVAVAVNFSTSCVDNISLLGCFDVVCVWRCCSLSNSTSFLCLFVADVLFTSLTRKNNGWIRRCYN